MFVIVLMYFFMAFIHDQMWGRARSLRRLYVNVSSFTINKVWHFLFDLSITDTNCIFEAHISKNKCLSIKQNCFCFIPPLEIEVHVLNHIQINKFYIIRSLHGNKIDFLIDLLLYTLVLQTHPFTNTVFKIKVWHGVS